MIARCVVVLGLGLASEALAAAAAAPAPSWPMFRGPNGAGVAEGSRPPARIGVNEGVLWKVELPSAPSSPCVWGDRLFVTTVADRQLQTRAYDRLQGRLLWTRVMPAEQLEEYHDTEGSPAASTPAADAEVVVSYFGSAGLVAYDHAGQELWSHRLPVAQTYGGFGSGTSPILAGDRVILSRDVLNGPALMALDRRTGRKLWETKRPDSLTSYSTPIVWEHDGTQELVVAGSVSLKGYDLATGTERWVVRGIPPTTCTTPVVGEGMLFFAGWGPGKADMPIPSWESQLGQWDKDKDGVISPEEFGWGPAMFRSGDTNHNNRLERVEWNAFLDFAKQGENVLIAVKPGGHGDVTSTHVAWKATRGLPYVSSPLYYGGRVYVVKDGGLISSFNARTGEALYVQERIPDAGGSYYASPVAADGRVYLASQEGKVTVLDATAPRPVVVSQAAFGERIAATPALVDGHLYLRTAGHLYAFGS